MGKPERRANGQGRLAGRTAVVTGATRGLGRAVALALAREGAHVIATARRAPPLEDLDDEIKAIGGSATLIPLDMRHLDKVDELGPALHQRWPHIDIAVANAGMLGPLSPLGHIKADIWQAVMDVNLNANWRLIRTLDPLLQAAPAGRAVFVSSGAASGKKAYWGAYAVSKAGLEALARSYAAEIVNTPVCANIVNPGPLRTGMRARAFPGEDPETLPAPEEVAELFVRLCLPELTDNGATFEGRGWLSGKTLEAARKPD